MISYTECKFGKWRERNTMPSFLLVFFLKCRIIKDMKCLKKMHDTGRMSGMEHTVRKNKRNRISMRITASIFILIAAARVMYLLVGEGRKNVVITMLCVVCFVYGVNLIRQTLKPQAYDITYVFLEQTMTLKMHKKDMTISYGEITELGYVVPNENLDYSLIQIYIGKEQFVIPFAGNTNVGEALYGMLKLKKEEAKETDLG